MTFDALAFLDESVNFQASSSFIYGYGNSIMGVNPFIYHLDCLIQIIAGQWDPGAGTVTVTLQTGENAADILTEFEASFLVKIQNHLVLPPQLLAVQPQCELDWVEARNGRATRPELDDWVS